MQAEELVREGKPHEALSALEDAVRAKPADATLRVFLFQLLSVLGQWERALAQLNVAAELDAENLLMAQVCRCALQSEVLREEVFAGRRTPLVLGEPREWMGQLIQANATIASGSIAKGMELRDIAFEGAMTVPGEVDGKPFAWLADADSRMGPVLEGIVDGRYYWIPLSHVREIHFEEPTDLRDVVWAVVQFTWVNGGQAVGLIPARYPGTPACEDETLLMSRRTDWEDLGSECFTGLGQRVLATDGDELPLLGVRHIRFEAPEADGG